MNIRQIPWTRIGAIGALVGMALVVAGTVKAGAQTAPDAKDRAHAERLLGAHPSDAKRVGGNGIVEPKGRETRLASNAQGVVVRVLVNEGDHVAAGAPLVELESSRERAVLAAAESDLAFANAELARALHGLRAEDVDAASAEAEAARSRAELAAVTLARTEQLAKTGAASADELDRARHQSDDATALARASDARRRAAVAGTRGEDIAVARARVAAAKARRDEAHARLEQLTLTAPHAGEVLQIKVRTGEYYVPGAGPLVVLGDTEKLQVRLDVDERDIASLGVGARASVEADAFPGRKFSGTVIEIGRRMGRKNVRSDDPTERIDTKILEVVVELDDKAGLVPGLRVMGYLDAR